MLTQTVGNRTYDYFSNVGVRDTGLAVGVAVGGGVDRLAGSGVGVGQDIGNGSNHTHGIFSTCPT